MLLELDAKALMRARLQVESFEVQGARVRIPVTPTNLAPLVLTDGNLSVVLPTTNTARLRDCSAWFRGVRIQANGEVTDYLEMRDWKLTLPSLPETNRAKPRLTGWEILQRIYFTGSPVLDVHFFADGRDRNSVRAELVFKAASAETPWGKSGPIHLNAACARLVDSGRLPCFQARINAQDVRTPWGASGELSTTLELTREKRTNFAAMVHLQGHGMSTAWQAASGSNWARVGDLRWDGTVALPSPDYWPNDVEGTLQASGVESSRGSAAGAWLSLLVRRPEPLSTADPAWGGWNQIRPYAFEWQVEATNILTPQMKLDRASVQGTWHPPQLTIDKLEAAMYRGKLKAAGSVDAVSRQAQATMALDFDPHQIAPLLTGPAQHWISLYDWETPPSLKGGIRFVFPPWTNGIKEWPVEYREKIELAGDFSVGRGAYRGIAVKSAGSHFSYTNRVWEVSGLRVEVPGGAAGLDYRWNEATHDFRFKFESKLNPAIAQPLLTAPQQEVMRQAVFSEPPDIEGEVWGNWSRPGATGFTATVAASHFIVRGEKADRLSAKLDYTNHFLGIRQLNLDCGGGHVDIPVAGVNFASNIISLSNASSTIDPEPVRRALGQVAPPFMSQVHFDTPPLVQASGSFTPGDDFGSDMSFFVKGDHFHWDGIAADSIQGAVQYHIRTVILTNVAAAAYRGGKVQGWVQIDWGPKGMQFKSDCTAKDVSLGAVASQWTGQGSKIEGMLDGHLAMGSPYNAAVTNLFGQGWLHVHNGLLWDIKLFGIFSPVLNAIAPGSGDSRAREASATFSIAKGVVTTSDLEVRSQGFRLLYRGDVDPQQRLRARAEAYMLRDTPLFGHVLGWMLLPLDKLFEFRVSGTLQKPVAEPIYIPKALMAALHPFHTLKGWVSQPRDTKPDKTAPPK
jgi:hypothetical protein